MTTAACVLVSSDRGATWAARGDIEDAKSWLVNPVIEEGAKPGQLVMMFRTASGGCSCALVCALVWSVLCACVWSALVVECVHMSMLEC